MGGGRRRESECRRAMIGPRLSRTEGGGWRARGRRSSGHGEICGSE